MPVFARRTETLANMFEHISGIKDGDTEVNKQLTVLRMKSGLNWTPSPHSLISSGVGSFFDSRAVTDSLVPPLTMDTKSSTMLPRAVFSGRRRG